MLLRSSWYPLLVAEFARIRRINVASLNSGEFSYTPVGRASKPAIVPSGRRKRISLNARQTNASNPEYLALASTVLSPYRALCSV